MIIIEGIDNSGKTTLINKLSAEFKLAITKSSGPKDIAALKYDIEYSIKTDESGLEALYDRHSVISETIYGPILRGKNLLDEMDPDYILRDSFIRLQPLIIYCRPSFKKILEFGNREQMDGVIKNAVELILGYDKFMMGLKMFIVTPLIFYNYEIHSDREIFEQVNYYIVGRSKS